MTEHDNFENLPVIPLGHTGTKTFFYFVRSTRQVVGLSPSAHTRPNFVSMASENEWRQSGLVIESDGRLDWTPLADALMGICRDVGNYDPSIARGRGAWRDGSHTVYHAGDALYVDGVLTPFEDFTKTNHRYLAEPSVMRPGPKPVSVEECKEFLGTLQTWGWDDPDLAPVLVLGWVGCSMVCGALNWRPHLWITGTKGSGKSTLDTLIGGVLGNLALTVQGNTTEPGLRQSLNGDARPVLFDEFEAENRNAAAVIDAARSAASDNASPVIKGTPEGRPIVYRVRFAGMFSGIIANLHREADRSRFVILEIHQVTRDETQRKRLFESLDRFGGNFGAALLRRMLDVMKSGQFDTAQSTIRTAIRFAGGDERKADVFANLLAAAYALTRETAISEIEARKLADLAIALDEGEPSDEEACLSHLLGYRVRVDYGYDRTIGEWLHCLREGKSSAPPIDYIRDELERHGVKLDGSVVKIVNSTPGIESVYAGTRWAKGAHRAILRRLLGADAGGKVRFAGNQSRYTTIPWETIAPETE